MLYFCRFICILLLFLSDWYVYVSFVCCRNFLSIYFFLNNFFVHAQFFAWRAKWSDDGERGARGSPLSPSPAQLVSESVCWLWRPLALFGRFFPLFSFLFFLIVFRVKTNERYCDSDQVCIVVVAVPMARINGVIFDGNNWIVKWGPRIQTSDVCTNITRNQKKCPIVAARPSVELIYMKTKPITAGEGCPLPSVFFYFVHGVLAF